MQTRSWDCSHLITHAVANWGLQRFGGEVGLLTSPCSCSGAGINEASRLFAGNSRVNNKLSRSQSRFHNLTHTPKLGAVVHPCGAVSDTWVTRTGITFESDGWSEEDALDGINENSIWLRGILASSLLALKDFAATAAVSAHTGWRSQVIAVLEISHHLCFN